MNGNRSWVVLLAAVVLAACSSEPKPQPAPPAQQPPAAAKKKEIEQETGRHVFQNLYITARNWAADAQPVRLESASNAEARGLDGKAAIWRARFASPSTRRAIKSFQWSGMPDDDGISPGTEDNFNPANAQTQPFDFAFLKSDSNDAFVEAQKNGGEKYQKKAGEAGQVTYELEWNARKNELYWIVRYAGGTGRLNILVNASTGKFIRVMK
jgi:hypothetical protein